MSAIEQSDAYKIGYAISMFEAIVENLGKAATNPEVTGRLGGQIDSALDRAKDGLRTLAAHSPECGLRNGVFRCVCAAAENSLSGSSA